MVAVADDAVVHLQAWLAAAKIDAGPLFRSVNRHGHIGGALDAGDVARIFKAMARRAKFAAEEIAGISGHSTRKGAAHDMVRFDIEILAVMQAGRWKSAEMPARYTQDIEVKRGAVAKVARKRTRFA